MPLEFDETPASAPPSQTEVRQQDRRLENSNRILIEIYEQTALHSLLVARESDLRTGGERITNLAADLKPFNFWGEAFLGAALAALWATGLCKFVPDFFGFSVGAILAWCGPAQPISQEEARDFGAALTGFGVVGLIGVYRWWAHRRLNLARRRVIAALQAVSELYIAHSAVNARLQRAGHHRVQVEARIHAFADLGWRQIEEAGGTETVRRHLDFLADIDSQRVLDEAEFKRSGGEYWLELLRAGLRGDLPLVICLYAAEGLEAGERRVASRFSRRKRSRALALSRAERRIFADSSERKSLAYRRLGVELRRVRGFLITEFDALLAAWNTRHPLMVQRETESRRVFEFAWLSSE